MSENEWPKWLQERSKFVQHPFHADYVSFKAEAEGSEELERTADLLLVIPGGLVGYRFEYHRAKDVCWVESASVPITAVQYVVSKFKVEGWDDNLTDREHEGTIHLDRELGPWTQEIHLPLNPKDYRGSLRALATAAGAFLDAVQGEMGSVARPRDSAP